MDELLRDFLTETGEHVEAAGAQLVRLERDPTDMGMIAAIFRLLHTIKGTCGFLGLGRLGRLAHAAEALLERLREGGPATPQTVALIMAAVDRIRFILAEIETREAEPAGGDEDLVAALARETSMTRPLLTSRQGVPEARPDRAPERRAGTIRVSVETLELIMTLVSELVLARNQLAVIARRDGQMDVETGLQRLSAIVTDLQDSVMRARMQPLGPLFSTLPRLVRDLARELGKEIDLAVEGGHTELDRQLVELVRDPLTHLLRNCADHGLESTRERLAIGKAAAGRLRVSASQAAGQVLIEVSDDGRGLDEAKIAAQALALGLAGEEQLAQFNRDEIARFIFAPGFSTATQVTRVSGRGVGLDIVRANIEAIGGTVSVESEPGAGVRFLLRIPLTLAIAPALIVAAGGERFAIPQSDIVEIVTIGAGSPHRAETLQGCEVLHLRGDVLVLASLSAMLRLEANAAGDERLVVVLRAGETTFGLVLDGVEDVQEIVVKPIGATLANLHVYCGHTILGDGSVVLLLDARGLARELGVRGGTARRAETPARPHNGAATASFLLVRAGTNAVRALPLALISRIETVPAHELECVAGHLLWRREGRLVALMPLAEHADLDKLATGTLERPVLMIEARGQTLGLLVDEILDVVEGPHEPEAVAHVAGLLIVSPVGSHVAEFIDIAHVVDRAGRRSGPQRGCHVLLLGATPDFYEALAPTLNAAGCRVVGAQTLPEALAHMVDRRVDVAIVEPMGLAVSARALVERLRAATAGLPVIAAMAHPAEIAVDDAGEFTAVCETSDRRRVLVAIERALRSRAGALRGAAR